MAKQNDSYRQMIDAIDGVIALSWEEENGDIDYEIKKRLVFKLIYIYSNIYKYYNIYT